MMTPLNQQYIRVKTIDPAVLCPAEGYILPAQCPSHGYILDEPGASEWVLLATFQTNSPGTTTFDPAVNSSGVDSDFAWDVSGTIYNLKSLSVTLDGTLRTVKFYSKQTITGWLSASDHIVGLLDLSYSYFQSLTIIRLETNSELTGVLLPANITGTITQLLIRNCNLTGELSLIGVKNINYATIYLDGNSNLTKVYFSASISGILSLLFIHNCNLTGALDLSKFTEFHPSSQTDIWLYGNANLTSVQFASSASGYVRQLYIYNTGLTGTLDLSGINLKTGLAVLQLHTTSLSKIIFKSQTAAVLTFQAYSANITEINFADVAGFTSVNSCNIGLGNNAMTAAVVNKILVDLDSVSVSGYTSRSIAIAGTNAAPDSSSGGNDGLAAKTSLEGKGFTVTVTV